MSHPKGLKNLSGTGKGAVLLNIYNFKKLSQGWYNESSRLELMKGDLTVTSKF